MQKYFDVDEAAQFLRNARMGAILTPDELRAELCHVKDTPAIGRYAVGAWVPNWLVEKLHPTKCCAHNYVVFPTLDGLDTLLLVTMQCANAQLRCVMQLSDPLVKAFLTDALNEKVFTLLVGIENTHQCAVMSVPMEVDEPQTLLMHLQNATLTTASAASAMRLTSFSCNPAFTPSLIEGQKVEDVIAVLATVPTAADSHMAVGRRGEVEVEVNEKRGATLH